MLAELECCAQRWKLLLITVEMLAVANAKDLERIQAALDQLCQEFLGADSA